MTKLLSAIVLVPLLSAVPVSAADFFDPPPVEEMAATVTNWDGFYAGIHGGGARSNRTGCWDAFDTTVDCGAGDFDEEFNYDQMGLLLGAQAGFNFSLNENFVLGVEVAGSWANITGELLPGDIAGGTGTYNWLATGTARAGFTFDRVLLYAEGGVALAGFNFESNNGCDFQQTHTGVVGGLGAEFQVADNVSIFGEWNRIWIPTSRVICPTFGFGFLPTAVENSGTLDVFKVGANMHF